MTCKWFALLRKSSETQETGPYRRCRRGESAAPLVVGVTAALGAGGTGLPRTCQYACPVAPAVDHTLWSRPNVLGES